MARPLTPVYFEEMFGPADDRVDYDDVPIKKDGFLPIPKSTDSLEVIAEKLTALSMVVQRGASVAVYTDFIPPALDSLDAETTAIMAMTPMEKMQYDAWKAGAIMPPIDWEKNQAAPPRGKDSANRFARRAKAMNIIWKTDLATERHVAWVVDHAVFMLPIIKAVCRVEGAKRNLRVRMGPSEMDMAEIHRIFLINAITTDRVNEIKEAHLKLFEDIYNALEVLQARDDALKRKNEAQD